MTDIATLGIKITSNGINEASNGLDNLTNKGKAAEGQQDKLANSNKKLGSSFESLQKYIGMVQGAFAALGIGMVIKDFISAAMEMDKLTRQFTVFTGSATLAGKEMQFVKEQANRLGLDMRSLTASYALFMNAIKGTANEGQKGRDAFVGISEGMAAVGMAADKQGAAWAQLNQGIMKGKFEMEDLKTINEAGLPIFKLMADAIGVTTAEFMKMQSEGRVLASDVLPKLGKSMHDAYGVAAFEGAMSAQGAINKMNNAMLESKAVAGSALMPVFTDLVLHVFTPLVNLIGQAVKGLQNMAAAAALAANQLITGLGGVLTGKIFSKDGYRQIMAESLENEAIYKASMEKIWKTPTSSDYSAAERLKQGGGKVSGEVDEKALAAAEKARAAAENWRKIYADLNTEIGNLNPTMSEYAKKVADIDNKYTDLMGKKGADINLLQRLHAEHITAVSDQYNMSEAIKNTSNEFREYLRLVEEEPLQHNDAGVMNIRWESELKALEALQPSADIDKLNNQISEFEKLLTDIPGKSNEVAAAIAKLKADFSASSGLDALLQGNRQIETSLIVDPFEQQRQQIQDRYDFEREEQEKAYKLAEKDADKRAAIEKRLSLLKREYTADMTDNSTKSFKSQLSMTSQYVGMAGQLFTELASTQDQSSRSGFETAKAYNIGAALMSTAAGIMAQFTGPDGWTPLAWARAAMVGVTGAIQVAQIASTSFGGGGGVVAGVPSGAFGASGDTAGVGTKIGPALVTGQSAYGEGDALQLLAESAISASLAIGDLVGAFESVSESFTTDSAVVSMFRNSPRIVTEPDERILQIVNAEMAKSYNIASNAATALGTNVTSGMTGLVGYQRGNGTGNTPEAVAASLNKIVTDAQDLYAKSVTGLIDFTNVGERAWDALQRLTGSLYIANDSFELIGMTLLDGLSGANMANKISVALGGDDEMQTVLNDYFEGMFTESEQNAAKLSQYTRQVNDAFYLMGEQVPETKTEFQNLVNSMDTTTKSGAEMFVELMKISPAFIGMKEAAEDLAAAAKEAADEMISAATDALRDSIDAEIKMLQDRANITAKAYAESATVLDASYAAQRAIIVEGQTTVLDALKTGLAEATKAAATLQTTFDMLKSAREGMQLAGNEQATWNNASADLQSILNDARSGNTSRIAGMADTAKIVSGISADSYTNSADYQRAFWQTSNSLSELEAITGKQLTDAQQQVESLNTLITATTTSNAATLKAFDAELNAIKGISANILPISEARMQYGVTKAADAAAQLELTTQTAWLNKQYDMLTNVNNSVISVQSALNSLAGLVNKPAPAAIAPAAIPVASASNNQGLTIGAMDSAEVAAAKVLYQSATGGVNTSLYNQYVGAVGGIDGVTGWNGDPAALRKYYSFAVGTNYVPYDMTANIHEGERIIPKADNYRLSQDNKEMIAELKALRAEMKIQAAETAKNTQKTAKILDQWNGDGMPIERAA